LRYRDAFVKADDIALELLNIETTTIAGVVALMNYGLAYIERGLLWPDNFAEDEHGKSQPWLFHMNKSAASAIDRLMVRVAMS
jgi:hypothetical protein